jgi:hypothetical protein
MEIKLSKPETMVTINKKEESVRDIELDLLKNVCSAAFQLPEITKDVKKSNLAADMFGSVENLTDADDKITMEKEDLDIFHQAWGNAQFRRSPIWMYARDLRKQLA